MAQILCDLEPRERGSVTGGSRISVIHLSLRGAPPRHDSGAFSAAGFNISAAAGVPRQAADHLWHMRKYPLSRVVLR